MPQEHLLSWQGEPPEKLPHPVHPHLFIWQGIPVLIHSQNQDTFDLSVNGKRIMLKALLPHHTYLARLTPPKRQKASIDWLRAPMPGLVKEIRVQLNDIVDLQTPLVVLEAMKMENLLFSPLPAKVVEIPISPGQSVEKDAPLIRLMPL
ncbi:MAG: acetyl-CoA carboxylase biotin carboxyl carrier protein subunit [Bacteroidia bacterium]